LDSFSRAPGLKSNLSFFSGPSSGYRRPAPAVEHKERWMELRAQAAKEQDPERLFKLVQEINTLLEEKEARLKGQNPKAEN
jgi:hypothetical protein